MNSLNYGDLHVSYSDTGKGCPLILLHAGGSSSRQWRKVGQSLTDSYRLIAPDLIGFGETTRWPILGQLTHDHQADLVVRLIEKTIDDAVHIVAHSYGGATAIRLYLTRPELVSSLVLIEPMVNMLLKQSGDIELFEEFISFSNFFIKTASSGDTRSAWKTFIDLRNGTGTWDNLSEGAQNRFLSKTLGTVDAFKSNLINPTTLVDIRRICVPTLLIRGENTTPPERRVTEILYYEIPDCEFEIVSDAEHMSPLSHPLDVAQLIDAHVQTLNGEERKK